jgi:hypothetical protein
MFNSIIVPKTTVRTTSTTRPFSRRFRTVRENRRLQLGRGRLP